MTKKKFIVSVDWGGYCRGFSEYTVEAESEDLARELYDEIGTRTSHVTVRNDTETTGLTVKEVL